jgi:hypothetical protein
MADSVPILFTVNGSARHDIVLVHPGKATLQGLYAEIETLTASSPNCEEFMSKYKKKPEAGELQVTELRVKWNQQSHDPKIYPASTLITEDNFEAVVRMIGASGVGRDTFEVKLETVEDKK